MTGGTSGGTTQPGELDFDEIGRALVMALLSTGAGDGPDQDVVREAGSYFGQSLGLAVDLLVQADLGKSQEDVLRAVLDLPASTYPTPRDLVLAAATVLALRVRDGTVVFAEPPDELADDPEFGDRALDADDRQLLTKAGITPATAAVPYTLGKALEWLDACTDRFGPDYVPTWRKRLAIASAVQIAGVAAELSIVVGSPSAQDGTAVHRAVQARFRDNYGPTPNRPNEIVIERRIYRPGGSLTLAQARSESPRYRRLWLALKTPRALRGSLSLDLADLTTMALWEIKPINGLVGGVAQLFYYSSAHGCLAAAQGAPEWLLPSPAPLLPPVLRPVRLTPENGRMRFAMPFQVTGVPGLVGYVVIVLPSLKDLRTAAVLDIMRRLAKELRRLRGTKSPMDADAGLPAALVVAIVIGVLLVGAVAAWGPAAVAALAGAIARTQLRRIPVGLGTALAGSAAAAPASALAGPPAEEAPQPVTLQTFAGALPCDDVGQALAVLQALATVLFLGFGPPPE